MTQLRHLKMSNISEIEVINFELRFTEFETLTTMKMIPLFDFQIKEIFNQKAPLNSHRREAEIGCVNTMHSKAFQYLRPSFEAESYL